MSAQDAQEPMSLKEAFQNMVPESTGVITAKVISVSPLRVQAVNDDKLVLSANVLCLPRHLSTYTTTVDITGGTLNSSTTEGEGSHSHSGGDHSHSGDGDHVHSLATFTVYGAAMTVYNGLKVGDIVYLLSFDQGKKYYILDREG